MKNRFQRTLWLSLFAWVLSLTATTMLQAQAPYKGSIGLRTGYYGNVGISGKFFLKENSAIEAIFTTRKYSFLTNYRYNEVGALYKSQHPVTETLPGLTWYAGGGGYLGFYSDEFANNTISLAAVGGIEFTLPKIPLTISLDWMPRYFVSSNLYWSGFSSNSGGFRVAYTFGGNRN